VSDPSVFVVDDEPVIACTLAAILSLNGYQVKSFTSPREALEAAHWGAPDLLISDVAMPGITGIDLAIRIKARCPSCKILLFSGQAATQDLLQDARSRGHDFPLLEKPIHPSQLLSQLEALVEDQGLSSKVIVLPSQGPKCL
jgi:CheY-like chemotaxis protein